MTSTGDVSVVIRTRSATHEPLSLLRDLSRQTVSPREVVVIDSGSAPPILSELRKRTGTGLRAADGGRRDGGAIPLHLIEIPPHEFRSARALNTAIARTRGARVAVLSQDARPADRHYLERLLVAFLDPRIAGAYGRQRPGPGADPLTRKDLAHTYPPRSRTQSAPECWFVNTCSMIRRGLWCRFPFDQRAGIVEDHAWARDVQRAGYRIAYRADAVVVHHHVYPTLRHAWRRYRLEGEGLAWVHGRRPGAGEVVRAAAREAASDVAWLAARRRPDLWPRALGRRAVKHAALYWGHRRAGVGPGSHT